MNTRTTGRIAVVTMLLGAALAGCGDSAPDAVVPSSPSTTFPTAAATDGEHADPSPLPAGIVGTPRPGLPKNVDANSADAVSQAALTVMWTMDTAIDVSQHDAILRALPYLTPEYAAEIVATPPRSGPGAEWQSWADHKAWTTVTLESAAEFGRPTDNATTAYRQWSVTATPQGFGGWTGEPVVLAAFVVLTRASAGASWKVSVVDTQ